MLNIIYELINKRNKHLVPQQDLDGYCRAIWCEEGFTLTSNFTNMLEELKEICGSSGIYYNLENTEIGLLHFTLFQLQTFKVDPASWSYEKAKDVGLRLMKILNRLPPFHITYKGIVKTSNGIFMSGFPSYNVNRVRDRIRTEFSSEIVEPHPQDIFHSTVMRLTSEITEETMTKIDLLIDKYNNVNFGEVQPSKWIYGYGTWTQRETQTMASWAAAPRYYILHRGLSNGPSADLENNYENLLARIEEGWHVEVDLWFENNRWFLGHDYEAAKHREISDAELQALSVGSWFHCKNIAALGEMSRLNQGRSGWRFFSHDRDEAVLTSTGQIWCYPGVSCDYNSIAVLPERCELWNLGQRGLVGVCSDYLPVKFTKMKHDNTFLIQGPMGIHTNLMKLVKEYSQFGNIVISTYESEEYKHQINEVVEYAAKNNIEIKVVYNDLQQYENELKSMNKYSNDGVHPVHQGMFRNCYYHINTVVNGLKYVNTKYVIKVRTDCFFSNMDKFIYKIIETQKIVLTSFFNRGLYDPVESIKFHPSDILFGGTTKIIKKTFNLALENYDLGCPEVTIWKPLIVDKAKHKNICLKALENDNEIYLDHMCSIFEVYDINHNSPFMFKGITNIRPLTKTTKEVFTTGGITHI